MKRRKFVGTLASGAVATLGGQVLAAGRSVAGSGTDPRPNVLFVWTDQQAAGAMSNAGNRWLRTPAMDSLAEEGVAFDCAYCSNPICVPSRTSWITGRMPHETGVTFNATSNRRIGAEPLSRLFREAGYDTGYVGKWHIPHDANDLAWHGFDFVRHARGNRLDRDVAPACDEFLRRKRSNPFFLVASFVNPHDICEWARIASGISDRLPNGDLAAAPPAAECPPLPANFAIPERESEVIRRLQALAAKTYPTAKWKPELWRQYLWAYHRLVERVDTQIGKILQTLRETGAERSTLIVFSSDHGDGAAAHQWNQKLLFYEEIVRVPFIIRPPVPFIRRGVRDMQSLINMNLDFFPTVLDYAGIRAPASLRGRSVRSLVEGSPRAAGHDFVVSQSDLAPVATESGGVFGRMLRTARFKYIRYSEGDNAEQLFDLKEDPGEMHNLAGEASAQPVLGQHRRKLAEWLERHRDPFPRPVKARA